jgi:hypothetical protein
MLPDVKTILAPTLTTLSTNITASFWKTGSGQCPFLQLRVYRPFEGQILALNLHDCKPPA